MTDLITLEIIATETVEYTQSFELTKEEVDAFIALSPSEKKEHVFTILDPTDVCDGYDQEVVSVHAVTNIGGKRVEQILYEY